MLAPEPLVLEHSFFDVKIAVETSSNITSKVVITLSYLECP
jgi:hypothetical protein